MKQLLITLIFVAVVFLSVKTTYAYVRVRGYFKRSTGAYVMPYYRTNTDRYSFNNWSYRGNTNPFTGRRGYNR